MLFFVAFNLLLIGAQAKFYTDCGSTMATVQNVGVSGCAENANECILKRNSNASITIDFTPTSSITAMDAVVHGIIMNLPVPFPLPQQDACKDSGLTCPLQTGTPVTYKATLTVLKSYPKVKVDVKWELQTSSGDVVCVIIPAKIN